MSLQYIISSLLDVFKEGCWKEVDFNLKFKDLIPKLKLLSMASRAASTVQKYSGGFQRWKKRYVDMDISHFPANPVHVALYLMSIVESKEPCHVVKNTSYSIDWAHKIAGLDSRYFRVHHPSLYHTRTVGLCLIAYAGFLRYNEFSNLLCLYITFLTLINYSCAKSQIRCSDFDHMYAV